MLITSGGRRPPGAICAAVSARGLAALVLFGAGIGVGSLTFTAGPPVGFAMEAPFLVAAAFFAGWFLRKGGVRAAALEPRIRLAAWASLATIALPMALAPLNQVVVDHEVLSWIVSSLILSTFIGAQAIGIWVRRRTRRAPDVRAQRLVSLTLWALLVSWPISVLVSLWFFFAFLSHVS